MCAILKTALRSACSLVNEILIIIYNNSSSKLSGSKYPFGHVCYWYINKNKYKNEKPNPRFPTRIPSELTPGIFGRSSVKV